jgi:putative tricarboxylic transport membrane protein
MALFALPEALYLVLDPKRSQTSDSGSGEIKDLRISGAEAKEITPVIARQSLQGFLVGVMPGAGATIASFLGYAVERNIAKGEDQAKFGKGSVKGLAAPEAANNAACTGSFVPLLTLGIPGSGTTAILLGALIALNVQPGPRLMIENPEIFWSVIISMYIGNVVLLILNLPLIPYIAKILAVPRTYVFHPDGGLYRAEQCHRTAYPRRSGSARHRPALCRFPAAALADRLHSGPDDGG